MKKLFLMLLLAPVFSFSQNIVGAWIAPKHASDKLVFRADSTMDLADVETGKSTLRNISIRYTLTEISGEKFMEQRVYDKENNLMTTKKFRYKISGDSLFMPKMVETNGVERIKEFKDIYIRVK